MDLDGSDTTRLPGHSRVDGTSDGKTVHAPWRLSLPVPFCGAVYSDPSATRAWHRAAPEDLFSSAQTPHAPRQQPRPLPLPHWHLRWYLMLQAPRAGVGERPQAWPQPLAQDSLLLAGLDCWERQQLGQAPQRVQGRVMVLLGSRPGVAARAKGPLQAQTRWRLLRVLGRGAERQRRAPRRRLQRALAADSQQKPGRPGTWWRGVRLLQGPSPREQVPGRLLPLPAGQAPTSRVQTACRQLDAAS